MPSWTKTTEDLTKDLKLRSVQLLDVMSICNGTDAVRTFDGEDWTDTTTHDTANFPKFKYAIEWRDRIYCVLPNSDTVYYSSVPVEGAISWTSGNGYISIEPGEGQGAITGLAKVPGYLLIFKERALKRWNGSSTFPDDLCKLGTSSQESVVLGKTTCFYFSSSYHKATGVMETNGETTKKISRPIQEIIEAIPSANYSSIAGFSDGEIVRFSVGTLVYDGITYANVEIYYHISDKTWAVLGYPTKHTIYSQFIDGTELKTVCGDDDGQIIQLDVGQKDNWTGNANKQIQYALQYHPIELGSRGLLKSISKVIPYGENFLGCKVGLKVDNRTGFSEKGIVTNEFGNTITIDESGYIFEVRMSGAGLGGETEIIGYDVVSPDLSESVKK